LGFGSVKSGETRRVQEPGLDRHEWESELQQLEPSLRDEPAEALPELADLVERILRERGYDLDEPVTRQGEERDVVAEYLAAREIANLSESGDGADPGDVGQAIQGLLAIFETLVSERSAP
jgi:hypothetical protein